MYRFPELRKPRRGPAAHAPGLGFTLVELMITLAVSGILLAAAVPSFRTFVERSKVDNAADSFLAAVQQARSEAITRGDVVLLCRTADPATDSCGTSASEDWTSGWLMYAVTDFAAEEDYDNSDAAHVLLRRGTTASKGIRIKSDNDGDDRLTFAADGTLSESGGVTYAVCDEERGDKAGKLIVIPMIGRPYLTKDMTDAPGCEPN